MKALLSALLVFFALPSPQLEVSKRPVGNRVRTVRPRAPVSDSVGVFDSDVLRVAINHATEEQLRLLPQIGPRRAEQIIELRSKRPFRSPRDLRRIDGLGKKTILRLQPHIDFCIQEPQQVVTDPSKGPAISSEFPVVWRPLSRSMLASNSSRLAHHLPP